MEEDVNGSSVNLNHLTAMKQKIEENKATLLSVIETSDLLLTELVGEGVMDEEIRQEILAGSTTIDINGRLLNWLLKIKEPSSFNLFLTKLQEYGQSHVANLLDGTPGDLPLKPEVRQSIQKKMKDLTKGIDVNSDLLDSLLSYDVISDVVYDQIQAERTKTQRAKVLLDALLRGSDGAFEKFKEEMIKTQPAVMDILNHWQQGTSSKPHVGMLKKHSDVLMRCTDINVLTVAFLRALDVVNNEMEDKLKTERGLFERIRLIYKWLENKSSDIFNSYLQVMQENEQKHVANLLNNNVSGQQPLSEERFHRLTKIRPWLMKGIHNDGIELASSLRAKRNCNETDYAISETDCEDIKRSDLTNTERNSRMIDAVQRRTDFAFECFEKALRETHQDHMADYLLQGECVGAHVNTTRPDKEDALADSWNEQIARSSSTNISSDEDPVLAENFKKLQDFNLHLIAVESQHSIMVYTYCKTPDDMKTYVKLLNSGSLQAIFMKILNRLLELLESENFQPLEVAVTLEEEDKQRIREFTGIEGNLADVKDLPFMFTYEDPSFQNLCNADAIDKIKQASADDLREQLQKDLTLIQSCKLNSLELSKKIENEEHAFQKRMEDNENTVMRKCDDLKEKVESFRKMVLHQNSLYKDQVLGVLANRKKAMESYVAVFKDYENYAGKLVERGSSSDIKGSFRWFHCRAERLQLIAPQKDEHAATNEDILELLEKHEALLWDRMDPDSVLLDQVFATKLLSKDAAEKIKELGNPRERNRKILEIVIKENKCRELFQALSATKQMHLVNFVCGNGEYRPQFGSEWPMTDDLIKLLESKKESLTLFLDNCNILTQLCAMNVISVRQKDFVSSFPTPSEKCRMLLDILKRGSINDFKKMEFLLNVLQAQNQEPNPILQQRGFLEAQNQEPNPILQHRGFLEEWMYLDLDLLEKPLSLTKKELKEINGIKGERMHQKKNGKLLDIVVKNGKVKELFTYLRSMNQQHIVNYLDSGGVHNPNYGEDWPLTQIHVAMLNSNWKYLVENLKTPNLLEKLQSLKVITKRQEGTIANMRSFRERNVALLHILMHGSINSYKKMVNCLHETNQSEIAHILAQILYAAPVQTQVTVDVRVQINKEVVELISSFNELVMPLLIGA